VSPLFVSILHSTYDIELPTECKPHRNAQERRLAYFLVDGIYPRWNILARPIHEPVDESEIRCTKAQEAMRKDIEPAFGLLQARFNVLRKESNLWLKKDVLAVSETCVILQNIFVRMNQEGAFQEETSHEGESINLVTELYEHECGQAQQREIERKDQEEIATYKAENGGVLDMESMQIREGIMKSSNGFQALRDDLMKALQERCSRG